MIIFIKLLRYIIRKLNSVFLRLTRSELDNFFSLSKNGIISGTKKGVDLQAFESVISNIPGMISGDEAKLLFYLSSFSSLRGDIIEIGSWLGKSTVHLALGCKTTNNGVVHAVDIFEGNPGKETAYTKPLEAGESILSAFKKNIRLAGVESLVKVYPMTSKKASTQIKVKARVVFIDACHDYDFVAEDVLMWKNLLITDGYLALHDYHQHFPETIRAIKNTVLESSDFETIVLTDSLLVLKKIK